MIVYVDVLFCLNLFVNYFLLLSVSAVNRARPAFYRLLAASVLGAVYSLAIFLPPMNIFLGAILKLFFSVTIILAAFSFKNIKTFLRLTGIFYAVSFAYCGIMLAMWFAFKPSGVAINNLAVYINISPMILIVSTTACYIIIRIISRFTKRDAPEQGIYKVEIYYKNKCVSCDALLDTGCNLHDLFSGAPVIIIEPSVAASLIPINALAAYQRGTDTSAAEHENMRLIPYSAIGGKGFMPAFTPDLAVISHNNKKYETSEITVAVGEKRIHSEYRALIGNDIAQQLF